MTEQQNIQALRASGQVSTIALTRAEMLEVAAKAFDARGNNLSNPMIEVEHMPLDELRAMSTGTNVLGHIADAIQAAGTPVGPTVGDLMDAAHLSQEDIHYLACDCHRGTGNIHPAETAGRLRDLAQGPSQH